MTRKQATPPSGVVILLLLLVLLLFVACNTVLTVRASVADELWNKYRVNIISLLQGQYSKYVTGLHHFGSNSNLDQTVLHIVTDPVEATWNRDVSDLGDFAGYVPKWQSAWDASFTVGNSVANKYKGLLFSMANKTLASQHYAQVERSSKTFEESPHHERLQSFVQRMNGKTSFDVSFVVQEGSGSTTIHSPWGVKTSTFSHMSSIVRELIQTNNNKSNKKKNKAMMVDFNVLMERDQDAQLQLNEFIKSSIRDGLVQELDNEEEEDWSIQAEAEAASSFIFGRRRRRRHHPVVIQKPIIIKSKKFHMDFKAVGLIGIPVRAPFVDRSFIRKHKSQFQGNWFSPSGQFNLLPSIVWVAMKPQCTLRVSESEFKIMQQHWVSGRAMGMAVGGVFFRNNHFKQMAMSDEGDDVLGDMFGHSALEYMRQSGDLEDEASFQVMSLDAHGNEIVADSLDEATFTVKDDDDNDLEEEHQSFDEEYIDEEDQEFDQDDMDMLAAQIDDQVEPHSSFRFRRIRFRRIRFRRIRIRLPRIRIRLPRIRIRRRSPPPPPPPPPPPQIVEKVYQASFKSNSNVPQVLAITSDIL